MATLLKLGFIKIAKPKFLEPVVQPSGTTAPTIKPINLKNTMTMHPITQRIMKGVSSDAKKYTAGDRNVWGRKIETFKKTIKDPKKVGGAALATGLYFVGKNNPKVENLVNIVKSRSINFINKPKHRLNLQVPKDLQKGSWNLKWSKAF